MALVNSAQSVKNGIKVLNLLRAVDVGGESDPDKARALMLERIRDPAIKAKIELEVEEQREQCVHISESSSDAPSFDNLGLHIGQVYGDQTIPANASDFTPRYCVGSRLPHAWIRFAPDSSIEPPVPVDLSYIPDAELPAKRKQTMTHSTLDLVSPSAVTIIVDDRIDAHAELVAHLHAHRVPVHIARLGVDFTVGCEKGEAWARACGLDHGGAIAVRPDQHILARIEHGQSAEPAAADILAALGL